MTESALTNAGESLTRPAGWPGIVADWSSDQRAFKNVSWGMAMAVNFGYRHDRVKSAALMLVTAAFGATFVGMQGFEWTKLIMEGVRPWGNPWGAAQFGSSFFMITGFHGTHVTFGVIFLIITSRKVLRGDFDREARGFFTSRKGYYEIVEIMGLYWHFVDLVWVFIFALFYLW